MESMVLVLVGLKMAFASSLGVMFGWQPMPEAASNEDGPKMEYIVQIEPELVATLQAGQSIPITSDIPDDIGPIGRIRVVIGRDELPRQKLVTNFKPWPTKQPTTGQLREGLVETQFTVPPVQSSNSGRYASQAAANNSILPPSGGAPGGSAAATTNPFGQSLRQGAEQARNLATDVKQQILPPSSNELFGGSGAGQSVQNAINNTSNQFKQGLQRGVEQIADRTGQHLHQAVDSAGQDARNAADRFGRSLLPERSTTNDRQGQPAATILPPSAQSTSLADKGRRINKPIQPQYQQPQPQQPILGAPPASFAGSSPARTNPSSQPGASNAPWPSTTGRATATTPAGIASLGRYDNQTGQPPAQASQWQREPSGREAFDLANRPSRDAAPRYAADSQPEFNTTSNRNDEPQLPAMGDQPNRQQTAQSPTVGTSWGNRPSVPEIRGNMLDRPVADGIQAASSTQGHQQAQQNAGRQPADAPSTGTQTRFDQNQNRLETSYENPDTSNDKMMFPLAILSVLLTSSGIGNVYLCWSYFDVRNKYRGVVHSSPRRRDRYDD